MKILILSSAGKSLDNSAMWRALSENANVDLHFLDKAQQVNLRQWFRGIDAEKYDRILFDLMFKYLYKQSRFLRSLPKLTLYEEDAYLEFMPGSKWQGAFSKFYHSLPDVRIISTGAWVSSRLASQGIDINFVPKGFDSQRLFDMHLPGRDIFLGFIGRVNSSAYAQRHELLRALAAVEPLQLLRTSAPQEYPLLLNRIQCFVSADIGLQEYMAKNFEAMACGCLVLAKRQGRGEEEALGLSDGQNILLYDDLASLREKLSWVKINPGEAATIALQGREFAVANHDYSVLAQKILTLLENPFGSGSRSCCGWWKWW